MRRHWSKTELTEEWTLLPDELALIKQITPSNQLGFAVMLKYFQYELRYPSKKEDTSKVIVAYLAKQLNISSSIDNYSWDNSTAEKHRAKIRAFLGFNKPSSEDATALTSWLIREILPSGCSSIQINQQIYDWLRDHKLEPFTEQQLERHIRSATRQFEEGLVKEINNKLSTATKNSLNDLLQPPKKSSHKYALEKIKLNVLKADPGQSSLDSILMEIAKLNRIEQLLLPDNLFVNVSPKVLRRYRNRVIGEPPRELLRHPPQKRNALLAIFCYLRKREIIDSLVDLVIQTIHKISAKAENRVVKEFLTEIRKINGKTNILYRVAEASLNYPKGIIENIIYPVAGEETLRNIVREYKATAAGYILQVYNKTRLSYSNHYRRMLVPILNTLKLSSNNPQTNPVFQAITLLKKYAKSSLVYLPTEEDIPIAGVVPDNLKDIVLEETDNGIRVKRINYEVVVLQALRDCLRCKEIWVKGADRYRNPDEDLPKDFDEKRGEYYQSLKQPLDVEAFIALVQQELRETLHRFNKNLPKNKKVKILEKKKGWIKLTPLTAQDEPANIEELKAEIAQHWPMTSLLDILKETDLLIDFTSLFKSSASREVLTRSTLQKRLLLCLFSLGTNAGLKRISSGNIGTNHQDLRYIKKRFVYKESVRSAITKVVNAIFQVRDPSIWGEATTACASDSKKFGAWNQNLMTEWHVRYGGRGIMIYWHVEKKSVCIYSQLKNCSSSEVAAMIEGVLRHCTDMEVKKNYVDSHGQSEVAFAFSYLLGFDLLPRFRALHAQKLYPPEDGAKDSYKNLGPILRRPIKWNIIRKQYDLMIKYTIALKLGTADSESILRRFTRNNAKHSVYKALSELGKAIKTIFICRYLCSEALRREIHEGLNVVERWNSVNGFIYYGKGGEITSNRSDDQELSMLCLHLLQICLVYINTLMVQQVLASSPWINRLTLEDKRALTPLFHLHINPYGLFQLDMTKRLAINISLKGNNYGYGE